ncbi:hypothetical protein HXX76_005037 [Chlamydomonas incerta]|uniref:DUF7796 domain-containing protein n=1 Tax=Chlamydomonas incerta TaxID=51695 RepID=A0A835TDQ7_CHLIN|nr:hypothetical protein HXX76_005037 [Chlamydomonas incerta]|eukprot:KAG2438484.1 hypothetical protein HXX76_005037 [Chlamydomonas incerta]
MLTQLLRVNFPGWCKCVVLDHKSPPGFNLSGPGVVVLTVVEQEKLRWAVAGHTPWNHFGRKNLGFVYAVLHGAEYVFDTDDDNFVLDGDAKFLPRATTLPEGWTLHVPTTGAAVFNPYPHWGVDIWPRGFPLTMITNVTARTGVQPAAAATAPALPPRVCALQSLANADPDVDALYRLTGGLPLYFPPQRSWLAYPAGTYAPFNAQATLFTRAMAAALALPVTVHGRVSDIWRSYIMQRAMWDLGCGLAFADPWVTQYRNAHKYLRDFQSELDLYLKTEGLIEVLNGVTFPPEWRFASTDAQLAGRVLALYITLYEHGLLEVEDVLMVHAFLRDLGAVGQNEVDFALRVNDFAQPAGQLQANGQQQPAAAGSQQPTPVPGLPRPPLPAHRAAVCVTGMFRAGPFLFPSHVKHVLSHLGMPYDMYVSTPDLAGAFPSSADYTYFLLPYKVVHANYSRVDALLALPGWANTGFTGVHNPGKWLRQVMDMSTCLEAVLASNVTYTHAARLRADTWLTNPLPVPPAQLGPRDVVVPNNEGYGGINDRIAYGSLEGMKAYLSLVDSVPVFLTKAGSLANAESALQAHLNARGASIQPRQLQPCRFRNYTSGKFVCDHWDHKTFQVCRDICDAWHADVAPAARHRRRRR